MGEQIKFVAHNMVFSDFICEKERKYRKRICQDDSIATVESDEIELFSVYLSKDNKHFFIPSEGELVFVCIDFP